MGDKECYGFMNNDMAAGCRTLGPLAQGVKPGVSLTSGVACEFILAFLLNLAIFASMGRQNSLVVHA